jgi:hypothetical protein
MKGLTIAEAQTYTGYSRPTWLKWLDKGIVKGEKGDGATDAWFISSNDVERIRQEKIKELQAEIEKYSLPVPME